jgi:hypothetical protein
VIRAIENFKIFTYDGEDDIQYELDQDIFAGLGSTYVTTLTVSTASDSAKSFTCSIEVTVEDPETVDPIFCGDGGFKSIITNEIYDCGCNDDAAAEMGD